MPSRHSYNPIPTHAVCELKACSWHRRSSACRELPAASRNHTAQAGQPDLASANKDLATANTDLVRYGLNQQRSGQKWLQPSTQVLPTKQVVGLLAAIPPNSALRQSKTRESHTVMLEREARPAHTPGRKVASYKWHGPAETSPPHAKRPSTEINSSTVSGVRQATVRQVSAQPTNRAVHSCMSVWLCIA